MISVIIPVYNVEKYIEDCLSSFENQNYTNFELILVNDGSKDDSVQIIKNYILKSNLRIRLLNQRNAGVSAARNKGLENISGEFICFVDSDDMVSPYYLGEMRKQLYGRKNDVAICGHKSVKEDFKLDINVYTPLKTTIFSSKKALNKFLYRKIKPGVWTILIPKHIVFENKLLFSVGFKYSEDIEFLYKVLSNSEGVSIIKNELYYYRVRNSSVMSKVDANRAHGLELMKNLEDYFYKNNQEFYNLFLKFGAARWVWATLWQTALAFDEYQDFEGISKQYDASKYMKNLLFFRDYKVSLLAFLFFISPELYYKTVRLIMKKNSFDREFTQ